MEGKFLGRFFCLYLIGILHATTDHGELVPEEGRLVFLLPNGIRIVPDEFLIHLIGRTIWFSPPSG